MLLDVSVSSGQFLFILSVANKTILINDSFTCFRSSRGGGGGYRGGAGRYDRRDHGGYRGSGGYDNYRRSPSPYHRRDDYRRRSRSRSYSPRKL